MKKYHFLNPKGVTAHNLLINGDFQVNQRGQSSYTCDGTKRVYGVDMWSFSKSNTFMKVTENGIETNAPISQMFEKLKSGVKYTAVCNIDNVIHTKSIVGGTYDTGASQTIMYLTFNDVERIVITPNGTQTINYVDLFEGEVVYKHQKEDYAIALTRCQRYIVVVSFTLMHFIYDKNYSIITPYLLPVPMDASPSVTLLSKSGEGNVSEITLTMLEHRDTILLTITPLASGNMAIYKYRYLLTCEPL